VSYSAPVPELGLARRLSRTAALLVTAAAVSGCPASGARSPGGQDPERVSEAEYDVARDLWLRQAKTREALAHAIKAVELDEDNAEAAHLVALLYLDFCQQGPSECRLAEAERYTRQALESRKDFREAKNTLGVILIHEKRYDAAIGVLKPLTADMLYQTPENAWGNLGWAYLEKGQLELAIDALQRAIAAQPLFCVGNLRLAYAHEKKGQPQAALEAVTRALETEDPHCKALQEGYAARARILFKLGRPGDARPDLTRCVELGRSTGAGKECANRMQSLKP